MPVLKMPVLKMPVLENAGLEMTVLEDAGTGKCQYWKMPALKLTVLEKEGTGTGNASTGVLPFDFLIGCEYVYFGNKL